MASLIWWRRQDRIAQACELRGMWRSLRTPSFCAEGPEQRVKNEARRYAICRCIACWAYTPRKGSPHLSRHYSLWLTAGEHRCCVMQSSAWLGAIMVLNFSRRVSSFIFSLFIFIYFFDSALKLRLAFFPSSRDQLVLWLTSLILSLGRISANCGNTCYGNYHGGLVGY